MLRRARLISQVVFFVLFSVTVLLLTRPPLAYTAPSEWFLMLNPLIGLLTFAASRGITVPLALTATGMALLTIFAGRFFCGMICPLGAIIDFFDRFLFKRMRIRKACPPKYVQKFKYVLLVAMVVMAAFGSMFPFFMDPVLMMTRAFALIINPLLGVIAQEGQAALAPLLGAVGLEKMALATVRAPMFYGVGGALALMVIVVGSGLFDRRFWCQYVCPSGALFGLLGRFALFRRRVDTGACNSCKACVAACPTRAITEDGKHTAGSECIVCGVCTARKKACNSFGFAPVSRSEMLGADIQRRHVLAGIVGGILAVPALRANASAVRDLEGRVIRPPGAIPEEEFLGRCISCGACMKVCPTNAIQPCLLGDGLQRMYTPKIVPRIGGCEEKCHICGHACPTGALRTLTYEQKRFVKIGTAVIDRHRCLPWEQNRECLVCDEVCPYNAITTMIVQTTTGLFKAPVVDETLCLGCGMCEQHCPITDRAAIVVFRFGEVRRASGPYVGDSEKAQVEKKRRASDRSIGVSLTEGWRDRPPAVQPDSLYGGGEGGASSSGLPPGFVDTEPDLPPGFVE